MYAREEKGCCWLSAALFAVILTVTFVALVLYLGAEDEVRGRAVSPKLVRVPIGEEPLPPPEEDFRVPSMEVRPLHTHPLQDTLEEVFSSGAASSKEGTTKKKSEAVFPGRTDPDAMGEPAVVDPENRFDAEGDFRLPGFDSDERPSTFLEDRLKEAYGERDADAASSEWLDVLRAINESVVQRNTSILLDKLKQMYNETEEERPVSSILYPAGRTDDTSKLLSFGLLAVDLFLLHNVQQIAWAEERSLGERMLRDPEVLAMNALFLPPEKVKQMRSGRSMPEAAPKTALREVLDFLGGAAAALGNLGRAYRRSGTAPGPAPLDCLWTLYCRNLDKTAQMGGPYGFLAKMNGLGLRMMMGEFPIEKAMERLLSEVTRGWTPLNCAKLFPRCGVEEAKEVAIATALGENTV